MKLFALIFTCLLGAACTIHVHDAWADDDNGGSNHHNTYMTTNNTVSNNQSAAVSAEQNNSVDVGVGAPGLAGSSYDCNIESTSYSVLLWSYGKAKCEKDSLVWRDVYRLVHYANYLGLDETSLAAAVQKRVCSSKTLRKVVGTCPVTVRVVPNADSERH